MGWAEQKRINLKLWQKENQLLNCRRAGIKGKITRSPREEKGWCLKKREGSRWGDGYGWREKLKSEIWKIEKKSWEKR